jgi:hypothetical protein
VLQVLYAQRSVFVASLVLITPQAPYSLPCLPIADYTPVPGAPEHYEAIREWLEVYVPDTGELQASGYDGEFLRHVVRTQFPGSGPKGALAEHEHAELMAVCCSCAKREPVGGTHIRAVSRALLPGKQRDGRRQV